MYLSLSKMCSREIVNIHMCFVGFSSMFDDTYEQPRPHQLPALDTHYLYADEEPKKRHKKRKKHRSHRHHESSVRRSYEPDESRYANVQPPSDEDLVVVPGKQNYFE